MRPPERHHGEFLMVGQEIKGPSPIRCSAERANGRCCNVPLGAGALGSVLEAQLPKGTPLPEPDRGYWLARCPRCGTTSVFRLPGTEAPEVVWARTRELREDMLAKLDRIIASAR